MIPSANNGGDLTSNWHSDTWAVHQAATTASGPYHNISVNSSSAGASAGDNSRYPTLHRNQVLDWENAMLLAQHNTTTDNGHDSLYEPASGYNKTAAGIASMQAEAFASLSQPRRYEELLSAHMASSNSAGSFPNNVNAWGLLNTVCSRSSGTSLQQQGSLLATSEGAQYSYESLNGADGLGGYGSLAGAAAAATGLYAESLRSSGGGNIGLSIFDQRRLADDTIKRELYTAHDLNSARLGLNLGGRTYFSTDDFVFGRWGKRLRPNSPAGCVMQPAPLCQAEGCKADLSMAKHYHRRHKVCEYHSKASTVHIGDQTQRFCQQCSRFHLLDEFDDGKRSCRKRLADHNRRRRKPQPVPASQQQVTSVDAAATVAAGKGADDQQAKDRVHSQETTTGSDSPHTGAVCSKASPAPSESGNGAASISPLPAIDHLDSTESGSHVLALHQQINEQEKLQKPSHEESGQRAPAIVSPSCSSDMKGLLNHHEVGTDNTHLAATLSLGAGAASTADQNIRMDVKPALQIQAPQASIQIDSTHCSGGFYESPLGGTSSKPAVAMPWLQGSCKKSLQAERTSLQGPMAASQEAADANKERGSINGGRGNWMWMKGNHIDMGAAAEEISCGRADQAPAAGGHELLRLLGDERDHELLSMTRYAAARAVGSNDHNSSSSTNIGTLAFLDHSLADSLDSARPVDQQRLLHFSASAGADHSQARMANRFA